VTFFVCRIDGSQLGEFTESEFQAKVSAHELTAEDYYWHDGMPDWRPISDYRLLAKTQRISFVPPMRTTVKISTVPPPEPKPRPKGLTKLLERIRIKK
jgi:hypothetical protein